MDRDEVEFRAVYAIREAVPTRAHAEMLFDQVADLLGDAAWVESWNGQASRTIYRRESPGSPWVLPWPVMSVSRGGREGPSPAMTAVPGVYVEPEVRPGRAPRIRGLGPGKLEIHDGPNRATVSYGKDGRWFECERSISPDALSGVVAALATRSASPVELVASYVAGLDPAHHGPGRLWFPVGLPLGIEPSWACGLASIRQRLIDATVPPTARWLAVDGWTGTASAFGATRDAAIVALRADIARVRPFPTKPKPSTEPLPESTIEQSFDGEHVGMRATLAFRGPTSDVPWVEPSVENAPAVVVALCDLPADAPPLGRWARVVGVYGESFPAALLREGQGFTLVGDTALRSLDPWRLDELLDEADAAAAPEIDLPEGWKRPVTDTSARCYRLADERTGESLTPSLESRSWTQGFNVYLLDAARIRCGALRVRREARG